MSYPPNYGWYYDPYSYHYAYSYYQPLVRVYPPIQTGTLSKSVVAFRKLMEDGSLVLDKLSEQSFAVQLMTAAQAGNQHEVDRLMHTISTSSTIQTKYSPGGVIITMDPNVPGTPCCKLAMTLKWGEGPIEA